MKRAAITLHDPIGAAAARHSAVRNLFEDLGLDYYCEGQLTIDEACRAAAIDIDSAWPLIAGAAAGAPDGNWEDVSLTDLVNHLDNAHHSLVRTALFRISLLFADACRGIDDIRLAAMRIAFRRLSAKLIAHMEHEELTVFPALVALEAAWTKREPAPPRFEGGMRQVVSQLILEHFEIGRRLSELQEAHEAIAEPERAPCARLFAELEQLARHIHEYINLENYVAFPRAIALEDALHKEVA